MPVHCYSVFDLASMVDAGSVSSSNTLFGPGLHLGVRVLPQFALGTRFKGAPILDELGRRNHHLGMGAIEQFMQGLGAQPEADSDELDLDAGIQIESSHAIGGHFLVGTQRQTNGEMRGVFQRLQMVGIIVAHLANQPLRAGYGQLQRLLLASGEPIDLLGAELVVIQELQCDRQLETQELIQCRLVGREAGRQLYGLVIATLGPLREPCIDSVRIQAS